MGLDVTWTGTPVRFEVDEERLAAWHEEDEEPQEIYWAFQHAEYPGAGFATMIENAIDAGVIRGAPELGLEVYGDDDTSGAGHYAVLRAAERRQIAITLGWRDLKPICTSVMSTRTRTMRLSGSLSTTCVVPRDILVAVEALRP